MYKIKEDKTMLYTLDLYWIIKDKVLEFRYGRMALNTLEIGKMTKRMEKENLFMFRVMSMMANG